MIARGSVRIENEMGNPCEIGKATQKSQKTDNGSSDPHKHGVQLLNFAKRGETIESSDKSWGGEEGKEKAIY